MKIKNTRYIVILIGFMLNGLVVHAQTAEEFRTEYSSYVKRSDTTKMRVTLSNWEAKYPTDAELFTGYFNYYFLLAKKEVLVLSTEPPTGESLKLLDSSSQTAGFMGSEIYYDSVLVRKGLEKIDQGIALYPNRLDMRFGKIYVLGLLQNYELFTQEIINTVAFSSTNKNEWTWTNNEKKEDGESFLLESMQNYQMQLYNTGRDDLLFNMRQIAEEILKYHPKHLVSLANIGLTYLIVGLYDEALVSMLQAEEINPKDHVVLSNIGYTYTELGNKPKAIEYFEKVLQYGDDDAKEFAKGQLKKLKSKD